MRILHSLFTNAMGGTERHLAELANYQQNAGHEVFVMLRGNRRPYGRKGNEDPFVGWLDPRIQVIYGPKYWPFSRWPLLPIRCHLKRIRPDIIHTHHGRDSRYLGQAAEGKIPVVATLHMPYRAKDFRRHDGLICVSQWQMKDIPGAMREHSVVVPNWVKAVLPVNEEEKQQLREKVGAKSGEAIIGSAGRLVAQKGCDALIGAFMVADLPQCHLCIFGDGELYEPLKKRVAESGRTNIHLMGYEQDIRPWYSVFDAFVLPSQKETFGLVLLEAMAAGCPIVTTRTDGAVDVLGKNPQVIWAEPDDRESLIQGLKAIPAVVGERWEYPELENHRYDRAMDQVLRFYQRFRP